MAIGICKRCHKVDCGVMNVNGYWVGSCSVDCQKKEIEELKEIEKEEALKIVQQEVSIEEKNN